MLAVISILTPCCVAFLTKTKAAATEVAKCPLVSEINYALVGLWVCGIAGVWAFISLILKDYRRRLYDPSLVLKYSDKFFGKEFEETRITAAKKCIDLVNGGDPEKVESPQDVDDVLDVLDDLGFWLEGEQISERVVYQFFAHWIQIYFEACEKYILSKRKKCPAMWEHMEPLYHEMMKLEAFKNFNNANATSKVRLSQNDLLAELRDETTSDKSSQPS